MHVRICNSIPQFPFYVLANFKHIKQEDKNLQAIISLSIIEPENWKEKEASTKGQAKTHSDP